MVGYIIGIAVVGLTVLALLSPLESLRWWSRRGAARTRRLLRSPAPDQADAPTPTLFVVYLSGVGVIEQPGTPGPEQAFVRTVAAIPGAAVVDEVFPYGPTGVGLLRRSTAWFWEIQKRLMQRGGIGSVGPVQLRNVLQVLVAADPRYGPTYYAGLAQRVWEGLRRRGYRRGCGVPVTLIGYSGGAQMSLGVAWFLSLLDVRCSIISIGGVYSDDPGFDHVDHFWDLRGTRDAIRRVGPIAFPGRWPINRYSTFNKAVRDGRVTVLDVGPVIHNGVGDYFDETAQFADGRTHAETLAASVRHILTGDAARTPASD